MLVTHTWVDLEHAFLFFGCSWLCAHLGVNGYVNGRSMARLPLQLRIIMLVVWLLWCVDRCWGIESTVYHLNSYPIDAWASSSSRDADTASSLHHFQLSLFYSSSLISSFWLYSLSSETHRSPVDPQQRPAYRRQRQTHKLHICGDATVLHSCRWASLRDFQII